MYRIIPVAALALGMAVSVAAQDSTVRSRTKVSGDDARALTLTGCLERGPRRCLHAQQRDRAFE